MSEFDNHDSNGLPEIYSKSLRAGRRTYFFDVRETKAGDYYLTITESKKSTTDSGDVSYKKHKIYLYKEDFVSFTEMLNDSTRYILNEKGDEVISEKHQKDFMFQETINNEEEKESKGFSDIKFEDI